MFSPHSLLTSFVGYLNDLWEFDLNTFSWIWKSGNAFCDTPGVYEENFVSSGGGIFPGARYDAVGWYDSVNKSLWIFGGFGVGNDTQVGAWISTE